jgi:voltage-gated potassium channel
VDARRRVRTGVSLLLALALAGILWYTVVEGWSLVDGAYQTVTTISTVGFGEARPVDDSGKIFSVFLMVFGVAAAFYTLGGIFEETLEGQLVRMGRRRMDRQISRLAGHTIVCGYGRVGSRIAARLGAADEPIVVVDNDEGKCAAAADAGHLVVAGDSTEDSVLRLAGIERARTLIVSLGSDADAISTVLSARVLNAELRIVARANAESSEAKLRRAGVDRVVNPLSSGAQRLAAFAQQPAVADFLDVVVHEGSIEYRLEELVIPERSPLGGTTLADAHIRSSTGALVLALRGADGEFSSNPSPDTPLEEGTTVIAIGTGPQLKALEELFRARRGSSATR